MSEEKRNPSSVGFFEREFLISNKNRKTKIQRKKKPQKKFIKVTDVVEGVDLFLHI